LIFKSSDQSKPKQIFYRLKRNSFGDINTRPECQAFCSGLNYLPNYGMEQNPREKIPRQGIQWAETITNRRFEKISASWTWHPLPATRPAGRKSVILF
jgi:hypothetical protein